MEYYLKYKKSGREYEVEVDDEGRVTVFEGVDTSPKVQITFKYYDGEAKEKTVTSSRGTVKPPSVSEYDGFIPRGWSTSNSGNAEIEVPAKGRIEIAEEKTYYMSYERTVTVKYETGEGATTVDPRRDRLI